MSALVMERCRRNAEAEGSSPTPFPFRKDKRDSSGCLCQLQHTSTSCTINTTMTTRKLVLKPTKPQSGAHVSRRATPEEVTFEVPTKAKKKAEKPKEFDSSKIESPFLDNRILERKQLGANKATGS